MARQNIRYYGLNYSLDLHTNMKSAVRTQCAMDFNRNLAKLLNSNKEIEESACCILARNTEKKLSLSSLLDTRYETHVKQVTPIISKKVLNSIYPPYFYYRYVCYSLTQCYTIIRITVASCCH